MAAAAKVYPFWFAAIVILTVSDLSDGFQWKSDEFLHVQGCVGSKVTIPWDYVTSKGETTETVYWNQGDRTMASLYRDAFTTQSSFQRSLLYDGAVFISSVKLSDTSYYSVHVGIGKNVTAPGESSKTYMYNASALLTVAEAPSFAGDKLDVQVVTSNATCSQQRQTTLSCGTFISRGFPPVDVTWTGPAGQVFPSTRFHDGRFHLDLPRRPLPGNYTCRLACQAPVRGCLPANSPLLGNYAVEVKASSGEGCNSTLGDLDKKEVQEEKEKDGFRWKSAEFLHVHGCVGLKVTMPWDYVTGKGETTDTVYWTQGDLRMASLYRKQFETVPGFHGKIQHSPLHEGAVDISNVKLTDTGYYTVQVGVGKQMNTPGESSKATYNASALLTVAAAPSFAGDTLDVQEVTSNDGCSEQRQITLSCGTFTSRGFPPVDVTWTDPAGQVFPSTRFHDGRFHLDLPRHPLPGNYTCHLDCQAQVRSCLPANSPLLGNYAVQVKAASGEGSTLGDLDGKKSQEENEDGGKATVSPDPSRKILEEELNELKQNTTRLQQAFDELQRQFLLLSESQRTEKSRHERSTPEPTVSEIAKLKEDNEGQKHDITELYALYKTIDVNTVSQRVTTLQNNIEGRFSQVSQNLNQLNESTDARLGDFDKNLTSLRGRVETLEQQSMTTTTTSPTILFPPTTPASLSSENDDKVANLTEAVWEIAKKVDEQCKNSTIAAVDVWSLEQRLELVETRIASLHPGVAEVSSNVDPLVTKLQQTFSLTSPQNGVTDNVIMDFAITASGHVVMSQNPHDSIIVAWNASSGDVISRPLKHGRQLRSVTSVGGDVVAATVDDNFIVVIDVASMIDDDDDDETWISTQLHYYGIASRSQQTLYASVLAQDTVDGVARIDVITNYDSNSVVITTLLDSTAPDASQMTSPTSLTLHEDFLYVSDWDSHVIIRLNVDTREVDVIKGPGGEGSKLTFFQPRHTAFDVTGNMYVTTGGAGVCGGLDLYSEGFCVVVVSKEGAWRRLLREGANIYPFGVVVTNTGIAVSWTSYTSSPSKSVVRWYDFVLQPNVDQLIPDV